jgi:hypothetical protein
MALLLAVTATAVAAVSVKRATLSSGALRVEGERARANATVTVTSPESSATGKAGSDGKFAVKASGYRSSTCKATVNDGSGAVTVTLSGCTPTAGPPPPAPPPPPPAAPPPPPPPATAPTLAPDIAEIGPGYVGADFTSNSTTGTTMTLYHPNVVGPVRFEIIAGQLPAGLSLRNPCPDCNANDIRWASVAGVPTTVQTTTFTIRATDANGLQATRTYTIRINPALALSITPEQWAPLTVGAFMNLWIDGAGGVKPYTWAVTGGQLPPGMTLIQDNRSGPLVRVSGTPTTAGSFTFTLRLTDAQSSTVSSTLTATVG